MCADVWVPHKWVPGHQQLSCWHKYDCHMIHLAVTVMICMLHNRIILALQSVTVVPKWSYHATYISCHRHKEAMFDRGQEVGNFCMPLVMMTSSNGNIFRVTGPLCGEFTGPGEFPAQRPVTQSFDVFFDLRLNKRLSKQPRGWWFETPSWSFWHQCNGSINFLAVKKTHYG